MLLIPIENPTPRFSESVNVGDVSLSMLFYWNTRADAWFVDLESVDGKNNGVKLVIGTPLLGNKNKCLISGDLVIMQNVTDGKKELGFENLGSEFGLFYLSKSELEEYKEAITTMEQE